MRAVECLLFMTLSVNWVLGARILSVMPMPSKSHHYLFQAVLKTLAQRGHHVVNYSPYLLDKPVANYTDILLEGAKTADKTFTVDKMFNIMDYHIRNTELFWQLELGERTINTAQIRAVLKSKEKYDLIILEPLLGQEALLVLGYKFKAPVIAIHPFGAFSIVNKVTGNTLSLATIPDFSFPYSDNMSFYERILSSYSILSTLLMYYMSYLPAQEKFLRSNIKDPNMPSLEDMVQNISLVFNNAHPTVHYAQPTTPNIVPIGGIHLDGFNNDIPPKIKRFLDEATDGVIYFALGSFLPDHGLPQTYFDNFIQVFKRLRQRVLWKTRSELIDLPDNVMTAKWVPQQAILAHQSVKLFLTHGGLFSQHEAIYAGVPVVCIPFFCDQPLNAKFYETRGIGLVLPFNNLSETSIHSALTEVLENQKYKANMEILSNLYKDQPLSAADKVVYWVEYVLKHGGAPHLRPASASLSWFQHTSLDILAVVIGTIILAILAVCVLVRTITRFLKLRLKNTLSLQKKKN